MFEIGNYCRLHKDSILGCSGNGRPECEAVECLYGAEPCPNGNHWKLELYPCLLCRTLDNALLAKRDKV